MANVLHGWMFICSYVERLLDCISNGQLADDRRNAMAELQSVVAESHAAQLAFGEMGEYMLVLYWYLRLYLSITQSILVCCRLSCTIGCLKGT